jgi:hypothetical protein
MYISFRFRAFMMTFFAAAVPGSAMTLVASASALAVAALENIDVEKLLRAVSPAKVACTHCTTPTEEGSLARCGKGTHVFCSTCFTEVVDNAVRGPSMGVCIAAGGLVPCTWCRPNSASAFDIKKFANLLSSECFTAWLEVMSGIKIAEESAKWAQQLKKKEDEHFAALCAAGLVSDEELVTRHYKLIAETLICAACPRCGLYIPDFDACCILQCGRRDGVKWAPGYGFRVYSLL